MPCDTITTTRLDLSKANADILRQALEAEGYTISLADGERIRAYKGSYTFEWQRGKGSTVTTSTSQGQTMAEKIQRKYSAAAVAYAAKKNGWLVKSTGENQYQVMKR